MRRTRLPHSRLNREFLATTTLAVGLGIASSNPVLAQSYAAGGSGGTAATASGTNATAVGPNADASGAESFAGGDGATSAGTGSVAIGNNTNAQSSTNVQGIINYRDGSGVAIPSSNPGVPGPGSSGAVTPPNESSSAGATPSGTAIGAKSMVGPGGGVAIGYNNTAGQASDSGRTFNSTAIGTDNDASGSYSTAIGYGNIAPGRSSLSLGTANQSSGDVAIALGRQSYALGNYSIAQGFVASAYGQDAIALGRLSVAGESGGSATAGNIAIGDNTAASGGGALALGSGASAQNARSVAIGAGSMALRGAISGNEAFSGNALSANNPEFSVGASGTERQITNVAGGTQDTDAVNVRQLRGLGNALGTTLGSSFNPTTNAYTAPSYNYGGATYSTVPTLVTAIDSLGVRYNTDSNGNRLSSIDLTRGNTVGSAVSITGLAPATVDSGAVALSQMPVRYSTSAAPTTANPAVPSNDVTFVGANGSQPVTLHNVATGTLASNSTDAVNGGQLYTTNQQVAALTNGTAGLVQQDPTTRNISVGAATNGTLVDLTGTAGTRRLAGLSSGTADSDAATVGQLRLSGNALASGLGGGAAYDPATGTYTAPRYVVGGQTYGDVGTALGASNALAVQYAPDASGNPTNVVDLAKGGATPVALHSVAAGTITSNSTDAVNGSQLYTTNQQIAALTNGTAGLVRQDATSRTISVGAATDGTLVDLTGTAGTRRLAGLSSGIADSDAATVGQLRLSGDALASALGGGAGYDPATGVYTAPNYSVGGRTYTDVGSALAASNNLAVQYVPDASGNPTNVVDLARGGATPVALRNVTAGTVAAGSTDAVNGGQLYTTNQQVAALTNGTAGLVQQDPASRAITVGAGTDGTTVGFANQSGTARTLTGVGAGQIGVGSTQAVNGGQIYAVTASLATALGGGAGVASDGTLTAPAFTIQGTTYNSVGSALGSLDSAVTNLNTNGSRYVAVRSTGNAAQALGTDSVAIGPDAVARADRGLALGAGAVASRAGMNGAREAFSGTAVASNQGAISVGDAGQERQITNLAGGTQDTDAVNVRQLRSVGSNLAGALGGGAGFAADGSFTAPSYTVGTQTYASVGAALGAIDTLGVKYDVDPATGGRGQSITLAGGDPNQPVLIRNVAAGVLATDAANVGQVVQAKAEANAYTDRAVAASYAASTAYTDAAVAPLQKQMNAFGAQLAGLHTEVVQAKTEARRGAAIGLAAASLRFDDRPGKLSMAAGGGAWRGEAAASLGIGYTLPDGSARMNATGVAAGRDFGVGAGASFTLN